MSKVSEFLKNDKHYPILTGIAAGLYPLLFYYSNNFTLINSWDHLWYFLGVFLGIPIVSFYFLYRIFKINSLSKWQKYLLPFLNVFVFLFLMKVCLYAGLQKKITLGILIASGLFAWFLWKHYKKAVVFQLLLACIGIYTFTNTMISQLNFSKEWMQQPDDIGEVVLEKKPNIYFIQPDGYVNFSELSKGEYRYEDSKFEQYLLNENFTNYADFRSNYGSTLSSNSSIFMMKHHFYNKGTSFSEGLNARNIIISDNTVLNVLKNNGYTTHFISEKPYLLLNRPEIGFHTTNFKYGDIPFISSGLKLKREVIDDLKVEFERQADTPHFYFMELFSPGHIPNAKIASTGIEGERLKWIDSLEESNEKLTNLIDAIKTHDPKALIMILSDHGGYVGLEYAREANDKTADRDLIYSMFSSQLSIHWPDNDAPEFENELKSSVNVFRVLFSHLSNNKKYLQHLQDDSSYMIVYNGAPKGVYQYLDAQGNVTFKKQTLFTK